MEHGYNRSRENSVFCKLFYGVGPPPSLRMKVQVQAHSDEIYHRNSTRFGDSHIAQCEMMKDPQG